MKNLTIKEKVIEKTILQYLNFNPNLFAFKYPTTGRYLEKQQKWIKTAGTITGVADIICLGKTSLGRGFVAFFEVKAANGRQTTNQKEFQTVVDKMNGFYFVVQCIEDINSALCEIENKLK